MGQDVGRNFVLEVKDGEKTKMLTFEYKMIGIAMMLTLSGYDAI